MKTSKILIALTLVLGVLTLSNCKKNEAEINPSNQIKLTINTSSVGFDADTKTLMDGVTPKWVEGDKIGVVPNDISANAEFTSTLSSDKTTASFTGTTTLESGANTIYAYYPYSTLNGTENTKISTKLLLPTNQSPTLTSFDGAADIMVGKPYSYTYSGSGSADISDFQFMRLMSVVKLVFKNSGTNISSEKVEKVTLIAGEALKSGADADKLGNKPLSGGVNLNLTNATFSLYDATGGNTRRNYVVANYLESANYTIDATGTKCTYLMINPVTIANGGKLTFEVVTSGHKITKTVTLTSGIAFTGGKIHTLNVSVNDAHIAVFNHSLPYTMNTTKNNAATDWIAAGWELGNSQTAGTFWGIRLGTADLVGYATSLPLSGFTDHVKVTFNAVGWSDETPKIYVSLLDENDAVLKSNFRTVAGGGLEASGTPNLRKETIMAEAAKYTMVFSEASAAKKVKIESKDVANERRFFLAYVKVETATAGDIQAATATTLDATNIAGQTARINGAFNHNDSPFTDITEVGFYWKKTIDANYTKVTLAQTSYTYSNLSSLEYATEYSYYAYLKVGGSEITGAVKTFTTTGPAISINPDVLTLGAAASSTATLTITSLAGQNWTATATGSGFTLSANTGTIGAGGTSTITITASNANSGASTMDLGTVEVKLDSYTSSVVTATIKQEGGSAKYYEKVTSEPVGGWAGDYLITYTKSDNSVIYALSGRNGNPNEDTYGKYTSVVSHFVSGNGIASNSTTDAFKCTIAAVSGGYSILFKGEYLGKSSASNDMRFDTPYMPTQDDWTITITLGEVKIESNKKTTYFLKWNNSSPRFACYTTTQTPLTLYKLQE